jgi:hypothetical protein
MNVRRQYTLPNCSLILDGLSDNATNSGALEARPLMSTLINAECHFKGYDRPISGGRDFFLSLIAAVSNYAQEVLGGKPRPHPADFAPGVVSISPAEETDRHCLQTLQDDLLSRGSEVTSLQGESLTKVELTTVELFDLVEAIDQFLADGRTLPEIGLPLKPLRRGSTALVNRQLAPIGLGFAGLAATAAALSILPAPRVKPPTFTVANHPLTQTSPTPTPSVTPTPTGNALNDPTQIGFLNRKLHRDLDLNWQQRSRSNTLSYRVSVNANGALVGYKPADAATTGKDASTPLPKLRVVNPTSPGTTPTAEPVADFRVIFDKGVLKVSPWTGLTGRPTFGTPINEAAAVEAIKAKLTEQLKPNPTNKTTYPAALSYRVGVNPDGKIVDYEPDNRDSYDYQRQTPLPKLAIFEPAAAVGRVPLVQYRVKFTPQGDVSIEPFAPQ